MSKVKAILTHTIVQPGETLQDIFDELHGDGRTVYVFIHECYGDDGTFYAEKIVGNTIEGYIDTEGGDLDVEFYRRHNVNCGNFKHVELAYDGELLCLAIHFDNHVEPGMHEFTVESDSKGAYVRVNYDGTKLIK